MVLSALTVASAQFVSVSGTVSDPTGHVYNRGTGRAILVSGNGSAPQNWTYGGTNPVRTPIVINALDSFGSFTGLQLMNTSLIDQQSAQPEWQFQFSSFDCPPPASFTTAPIAITSIVNLSTFISSYAAPLPATCIGSSGQAIPGGYTGQYQVKSATATFAGTNVIDPLQFPGADIGAKINAAAVVSVCTAINGCRLELPAGAFPFSTPIVLPSYVAMMGGGSDGTTELDWTPTSGTAISLAGSTGDTLYGFLLRNNVAASTATGISVGANAQVTTIDSVGIGSANDSQGFAVNLNIGGTDTLPAFNTVVRNLDSRAYNANGIIISHAVGTYISIVKNYAILSSGILTQSPGSSSCNTSGAIGLLIDTGTSGVQADDIENGCAGTIYQNSAPTTNAYGYPPQYIQITKLVNDESPANGMLFAASLDTPSGPSDDFIGYDYVCVECWHSASALAGIDVQGGTNIVDTDSIIRLNAHEGVKLEGLTQVVCSGLSWGGSCGGHTSFTQEIMNANGDSSGYADVHVLAGVSNFIVSHNYLYGTGGGDNGAGTDEGIKIESGASDHCTMIGNQIYMQRITPIINGATGNSCSDWNTITDGTPPRPDFAFPDVSMGIASGMYESGGTISGTTGQTCALGSFNGGGSGATGTVALTGSNTIAAGTAIIITATGSGYYAAPSTATLSNGSATCSGTATIVGTRGGASSSTTKNYLEIGDPSYWIGYDSGGNRAILFGSSASGGNAINFNAAANSGLGQLNFSVNGTQILQVRPSGGTTTITNNLATTGTMSIGSGGYTGHTVCWKTSTLLSYCTSVVASDGTCTCN